MPRPQISRYPPLFFTSGFSFQLYVGKNHLQNATKQWKGQAANSSRPSGSRGSYVSTRGWAHDALKEETISVHEFSSPDMTIVVPIVVEVVCYILPRYVPTQNGYCSIQYNRYEASRHTMWWPLEENHHLRCIVYESEGVGKKASIRAS